MRKVKLVISSLLLTLLTPLPVSADVLSSPSFELDGAKSASLATSSPTIWKDLVGGSISLTVSTNSTRSSEGGGSLQETATLGTNGAYLAPTTVGSASNPSGDMTLMMWVKPTSWNSDWNIIASRWFSALTGGSATDYHFAIKSPTTNGANHYLNLFTTSASDQYGSYDFALNRWYLVGFTLTSGGNQQFYVNGQADGAGKTGMAHTANNTSYLSVGDLRSNCTACSINGFIGKFRLWNSVLTPSQVLADYRNEAANFGYSTSTSIALNLSTSKYRTVNNLTATVPQAGTVTFYEKGKYIKGCRNVPAASTSAICPWKPISHGQTNISAIYTPTDSAYLSSSATIQPIVGVRTTLR